MKACLAIIIMLLAYGNARAQIQPPHTDTAKIIRICTPSRAAMLPPPLVVIFSVKEVIYKTNTSAPNIDAHGIESINVLKNNSAAEKYGPNGAYGVIEVYLKKGVKLDTSKIKPDTNKIKLNTDTSKAIKYRRGK